MQASTEDNWEPGWGSAHHRAPAGTHVQLPCADRAGGQGPGQVQSSRSDGGRQPSSGGSPYMSQHMSACLSIWPRGCACSGTDMCTHTHACALCWCLVLRAVAAGAGQGGWPSGRGDTFQTRKRSLKHKQPPTLSRDTLPGGRWTEGGRAPALLTLGSHWSARLETKRQVVRRKEGRRAEGGSRLAADTGLPFLAPEPRAAGPTPRAQTGPDRPRGELAPVRRVTSQLRR